jgi:hypothetical protein
MIFQKKGYGELTRLGLVLLQGPVEDGHPLRDHLPGFPEHRAA